jgi:hypothetical protein
VGKFTDNGDILVNNPNIHNLEENHGLSTMSGLQPLNAYRYEISISQMTMDLLLFTYIFSTQLPLYKICKTQTRWQIVLQHKPDDNMFYNTQQIATLYYNTKLVTPLTIMWKVRCWHRYTIKLCCDVWFVNI